MKPHTNMNRRSYRSAEIIPDKEADHHQIGIKLQAFMDQDREIVFRVKPRNTHVHDLYLATVAELLFQ